MKTGVTNKQTLELPTNKHWSYQQTNTGVTNKQTLELPTNKHWSYQGVVAQGAVRLDGLVSRTTCYYQTLELPTNKHWSYQQTNTGVTMGW